MEEELKDRHFIQKLVQENLKEAQARMKMFVIRKRTDCEFEEGDKIYLRLRPYRQMSVAVRRNLNLSPRYYGPYSLTKNREGGVQVRFTPRLTNLSYFPCILP